MLYAPYSTQIMSQEQLPSENDPDTYLIEHSVPDVRAFEQKTRYLFVFEQTRITA